MAPNFVSLYTNDTQVQLTPWDIRMTFGEISGARAGEPGEQSTIQIKTTGEVRMSPQHAKKLAEVLAKQIQVYEKNVGVISMPPD